MEGPAVAESPAPKGLSWVPYSLLGKIWENDENPVCVDLSDYGIDKKFWLRVSPVDGGLSHQLRTFRFREPLNCRCYVKFVKESDTLLDIGANVGFFTLLGSRARRIVCVEPLSDAIALLKENIKLNGISDKCEVVNAAVGPRGKLNLQVNAHMNLSKVVGEKSSDTIEVESIPLRDLVEKHSANLVRLDVEGFEFDILHGQIPASVDKISMEFHSALLGKERARKLLTYFKDEGFGVKYFIEDLPLRLYPLLRIVKNADLLRPLCYIKEDLKVDDVMDQVHSGRLLKYLYLQR